jgi:hypothetical protein
VRVKFEREKVTLADIEDYEAYTGEGWSKMATYAGDHPLPMRCVVALVWITERRKDPTITIEQIRQLPAIELEIDSGVASPNAQEPVAEDAATG